MSPDTSPGQGGSGASPGTGGTSPGARVPNIGPRERRKRRRFGLVMLAVGLAAAAALVAAGVPRAWRLALFAPFWLAGLGISQAREKT